MELAFNYVRDLVQIRSQNMEGNYARSAPPQKAEIAPYNHAEVNLLVLSQLVTHSEINPRSCLQVRPCAQLYNTDGYLFCPH